MSGIGGGGFLETLVRLLLVVGLAAQACLLLRLQNTAVRKRSVGASGFSEESFHAQIRLVRLCLPVCPLLFLGLGLYQTGLSGGGPLLNFDLLAAVATWGGLWQLLGKRLDRYADPAGPLSLLAIFGLHVGVLAVLSRTLLVGAHVGAANPVGRLVTVMGAPAVTWLPSSCLPVLAAVALTGYLFSEKRTDRTWKALSGNLGIFLSLGLAVTALAISLASWLLHRQLPVFALFFVAFLIGGSTLLVRCTSRLFPADATDLVGMFQRWCPVMTLAALIIASPLLMKDFSPSLILLLMMTVALWRTRNRLAGSVLFLTMVCGMYMIYTTGLVPRLTERISLVTHSFHGRSSQIAQVCYAISRGGLFGVGPGRIARVPASVKRTGPSGVVKIPSVRPAIPLADTDGVLTALGESVGLLGVASLFSLYFTVFRWMAREAYSSPRSWIRIYFTSVATLFLISVVWTAGWSVGNCLPMAGLAVPLMSRGWGAMGLWGGIFLLAIRLVEKRPAGSKSLLVTLPPPVLATTGSSPAGISGNPETTGIKIPGTGGDGSILCLSITAALLLFTITAAASRMAVLRREFYLTSLFHDRRAESEVVAKILSGSFVLTQDGTKIVLRDFETDPGVRKRLQKYIADGYVKKAASPAGGDMVPDFSRMVESEPSGIGRLLRSSGSDRSVAGNER